MSNLRIFLLTAEIILFGTGYSKDAKAQALSDYLNPSDIHMVLKAVADWQMRTPLVHNTADWTNAALFAGMAEWAEIAGNDSCYEWLRDMGNRNNWTYYVRENPLRRYHADDYCVGQMYAELYRKYGDKAMISAVRTYFDAILKDPARGSLEFVNSDKYWSTQRWSWCDALFMGPTVWAKIANITGKKKYLRFMYDEYKATTDYLYDPEENLYFRDSNYFLRKEANGQKVFWGRGNGWVFAGLPVIIRELPPNYRHTDFFATIFTEMAGRLLSLQQPDGSWHASLLDPGSYPVPEMSATAFFVFGLAWGVDNGYLDKSVYLPAVIKGWKSMVRSVLPDGKVGYIQPIGADPKAVTSEMTEVYGVGGFLMAGTQIWKMAEKNMFKNI
ncbi:MAG: glycoside hydrolase family 88 protein [Bacteroidales bacterium]